MPQSPTVHLAYQRQERLASSSGPKAVDVPKSLGAHDTNTVRDRVRQWQAQGGGVVTAPEVYIEDPDDREVISPVRTPRTPPASRKSVIDTNASDVSKSRDGRRKSRSNKVGNERHRSTSAPAKRVISDAHWRKNRSPPKDDSSPKVQRQTATDQNMNADNDGIRVRPMSPLTDQRLTGKDKRRRESKRHDDRASAGTSTPGSNRYAGKHRTPLTDAAHSTSADGDYNRGSPGMAPLLAKEYARSKTHPTKGEPERLGSPTNNMSIPPSDAGSHRDPRSASGNVSETLRSRKPQKEGILSQVFGESRKVFAKTQTMPVEPSRVPSVEAWLNDTPDPFVDADHRSVDESLPQPVKVKPADPTLELATVDDPNKIWDTLNSKDRARSGVRASRRHKRIPSSAIYEGNPFPESFASGSPLQTSPMGSASASKLVDLIEDGSESQSTLTRRGARKSVSSPKREARATSFREKSDKVDEASAVNSTPTTLSYVEPPAPLSPLRPPGRKDRPFPCTGTHRLSTIASVDTLKSNLQPSAMPTLAETHGSCMQPDCANAETLEAESRDHFDPESLPRNSSRLTKHADLISVLSMPQPGTKSIRSARSIRTNRSRLATATIGDLMKELADDEMKYMRELKTLVDGVIPVLLTCVLSKSDSAVAAGLFQPSYAGQVDPNFTKPIVDMGIALERLKTLHRRIPMQDGISLLTWAQGAHRVYTEYLKAWRMGFQDVVVNLAPATDGQPSSDGGPISGKGELDDGLPINKDGDVINGDGERVDVAFLLKRPLVRLKYLAKTLRGVNVVSPSAEAEALATKYQNLVTVARNRSDEERARLEDEAAANIDATRARDPRTLAPLTGVSIDRTRRVRARDHFNLALQHSSGQRIDCRVELLLRDEASEIAGNGDLLICEVDGTGRWLLFPPVQFGRVSARNGDVENEIVVMIRGLSGAGAEWHEILSLRSEEEQAGFEWVQMLGLTPVPMKIPRTQSFLSKHQRKRSTPTLAPNLNASTTPHSIAKSRTPSPREVEVPIGEKATQVLRSWDGLKPQEPESALKDPDNVRTKHNLQRKSQDLIFTDVVRSPHTYVDSVNDLRSLPSQTSDSNNREQGSMKRPRSFKEALGLTGTSTNSLGLKRARAQRLPGNDGSPKNPRSPRFSRHDESPSKSSSKLSSEPQDELDNSRDDYPTVYTDKSLTTKSPDTYGKRTVEQPTDSRPGYQRSPSHTPSMDLPTIPKIRRDSPPTTPIDEPEEEPQWFLPPESKLPPSSTRKAKNIPRSDSKETGASTPSTPDQGSSSPAELKGPKVPIFTSSTTSAARRRSSSPLKHEYEPSTDSDSSESDASTINRNEVSSVSSSDDDELEEGDAPTPLLPPGALARVPKRSPQPSLYSLPNGTLKPSESASQAPYKKVPSQPTKASKTIASIFSWSDKGAWESLHPDECSIVITPGLIEAFEMSAAHSTGVPLSASTPVVDVDAFSDLASNIISPEDMAKNDRPLVALELTPLVPLRRGTAIDISIRSPPTPNSQITSGNNILFRSRNPEECEALYALINHSRIHNPTYIALQNARGPFGGGSEFDRRASTRTGGSRMGSWFGGLAGSPGYRASSAPTPSIAPSESSIGSMGSAFSALKRFRIGGGGMFNIARSTISSREGSRANSLYTSSDNSSGSGASSPLPPGIQGDPRGNLGLGNTKIRLYLRESNTRWRDMGSARLTIMLPSPPDLSSGTSAAGESMARPSSAHQSANEKRILVHGKTKGEILLDATLGETCFERVGRQGIAVSVWEDIVGPNGEVGTVGAVGGVGAGRAKVYMIQVSLTVWTLLLVDIILVLTFAGVS
ncbi:MAG: hypothetical protein L6R40_000901 [Gallowayella cf. fulva]|nr:MAG: hypothetical protein L6R40_000901 [Xanthomendoza cf. fulva]